MALVYKGSNYPNQRFINKRPVDDVNYMLMYIRIRLYKIKQPVSIYFRSGVYNDLGLCLICVSANQQTGIARALLPRFKNNYRY